jgi:ABC-2 type transport system ATP-binding protein/sodium transport system ATP-binding protein
MPPTNLYHTTMIEVHQLSKAFELNGREFLAVDNVSFSVNPGTVYGLLGPNGAGKTTTMRMVLGLLRPDSGYSEISGMRSDIDSDGVKRQVGFVSAAAGVYQWLTAREMLSFFGDIYGISVSQSQQQIQQLSELLDFHHILDQRCTTLSTGEKQRVNLARALMHDPPVMILDEPTLGLDVVGSQTIFSYIDLLKSKGKAVILSTHRLEQAQRVCNQFGMLHRGRIVRAGTLEQLRQQTGRNDLVEMFVDLIAQDRPEGNAQRSSQDNAPPATDNNTPTPPMSNGGAIS